MFLVASSAIPRTIDRVQLYNPLHSSRPRERRLPHVERHRRHEYHLHRRGTVGRNEHISNDFRHSPRGGLSE
jgi:hypothetical protein